MYKPVDSKVNFPAMEEAVLKFWEENDIFRKSIEQREGQEEYVFYDGPPFATGLPHFGHFVPGTIKDIIPRYQAMKGKKVDRRFGWDCHGLPVEYEMEKELGISGKSEIEEYGVAKFNESCRSIVLRYTGEWERVVTRLGRWVDFENDYKTMEPDYMESIWWVFKQLWEKGLIYEGYYILPYSPALATPLSNFEVNLGGYQQVTDPSITVRFKTADPALTGPKADSPEKEGESTWFLAWTTTPWTLPSNLGLALGPEVDYVMVQDGTDRFILAESLLGRFYKDAADYTVLWKKKGAELGGLSYDPLFPYFSDRREEGAFRTWIADFVSTEDGTGIVHIAPGFGEDDYQVMKDSGVTVACPLDAECRFTEEVPDYQGTFVKDADKAIIKRLKEEGKLIKRENYVHSYPFCYRTKKPLIYRAVSSWFVDIDKIKARMLAANNKIRWVPEHLQQGRFGKWLEGAREWAISRNRFWGNPLPVWKCPDCGETRCVGSRKELEELSGQKVTDLHKHYVDEIAFPCACGGTLERIPEVLDCWFESGSMPYAQNHYPFENKAHFEANFPADFIAEGLDQTRGWFYTLTILAAALFDEPAFKNVIVNGLVLAPDGKKMSKSERNYTDPMEVVNQFGADALRLFLMRSAVVRAEDLKYTDEGVKDILKSVIIPLWSGYTFFVTYANIDGYSPDGNPPENPANPLDRWILSEAESLVDGVTRQLDQYDIQKAIEPIVHFIDQLNNWYIRRSRRRFWKSGSDADKEQAYQTLHAVLLKLVKTAAPFVPFVTEEIYQNLKGSSDPASVHLCDYPVARQEMRDGELEKKMAVTQKAVSLGRALRSMHNLKTRQPLKAIHLVTRDQQEKKVLREMEDIICEELNVKEAVFRENEEDLVEYQAKANFKVLGKRLGKKMKTAAARIQQLGMGEIQSLLEGATLAIELEDETVEITRESVVIQRFEKTGLKVINEGSLTVALDPEVTEELRREGQIRDLVRGVQNLRKEKGLDVTDRISLAVHGSEEMRTALTEFEDYLLAETLAEKWTWQKPDGAQPVPCGEEECSVDLQKAE